MCFARPSRQADHWVWALLWQRPKASGYDIEHRPIPDLLGDFDVWAKLESGEAVVFDKAIPEHRKLIHWDFKNGPAPMSLEDYEKMEAERAPKFQAYLKRLGTKVIPDDAPLTRVYPEDNGDAPAGREAPRTYAPGEGLASLLDDEDEIAPAPAAGAIAALEDDDDA